MISLLFVLAFVLLALLGTPLFIIIGGVAFLCFYVAGIDLSAVIIEMYRIASAPTLLTIPLFTFAGYVMAESGTPKRLIDVAKALVGWIPGGLAIVTLLTCAFFTGTESISMCFSVRLLPRCAHRKLRATGVGFSCRLAMNVATSATMFESAWKYSSRWVLKPMRTYGRIEKAIFSAFSIVRSSLGRAIMI